MEKTIRKIRPMTRHIVTTMDRYEIDDEKVLIDIKEAQGVIKEIQRVIAVGPHVRDIQPGDYVKINPKNYIKVKHNLRDDLTNDNEMEVKINFPVVDLEDGRYLFLWEDDVDFVIEEFGDEVNEAKNEQSKLIYTPPTIITT